MNPEKHVVFGSSFVLFECLQAELPSRGPAALGLELGGHGSEAGRLPGPNHQPCLEAAVSQGHDETSPSSWGALSSLH